MLQPPDSESNSKELIDQRIDQRIERLLKDPGIEPGCTKEFLDGPFRSFAHLMAEVARRDENPDEVASAMMFLIMNMVNELGMAAIGADRPDERANMGRLFFQQLREQWDDVVERGMISPPDQKQTH
jgi:hypothetical protein